MSKRTRMILLVVLGISLALILLLTITIPAKADDDNQDTCEFQPMAVDRSPTIDNIILVKPGGANLNWDNTYLGLHRWQDGQWPGVDYLVNTTVAFKNGGVVSLIEWDDQGGGNSIYIDGIGPCRGWRQFFGHLNYNPADRFQVNQIVGPDEVIGEPGCSGFTCTDYLPAHNHVPLGYWQNIFSFDDGTTPAYAGGYWWVHPARMEGASSSAPQPTESETVAAVEETKPETVTVVENENYVVDYSEQKTFAPNLQLSFLEQMVNTFAPHKIIIFILFGLLSLFWLGAMIFSTEFRRTMTVFTAAATTATVIIFLIIGRVSANSYTVSPPRNEGYTVSGEVTNKEAYVVDTSKAANPTATPEPKPEEAKTSSDCSLPLSYPESIRQWCQPIEKWAAERDMDPRWLAAVMLQESGGNPEILSGSGAVGLLQVMPRDGISATFRNAQGVPYFSNRPSIEELKNPNFNIEYGSGMLYNLGLNSDPRNALLRYGPRPDDLERVYGSRYYYADLIISIYNNYQ